MNQMAPSILDHTLVQGATSLPLPALVAVATIAAIGVAIILRVAGNYFHGSTPPVIEGIPFIGGLIKFSKVRSYPQLFLHTQNTRLANALLRRVLSSSSDLYTSHQQGPMELMSELYPKYGEVFTIPVLHKRLTFLFGPHVSPHFFNGTDDKMSQKEVYEFNIPTFGPGVVYDVPHKVRTEQFRMVANALSTAKLKSYVPLFEQEAESYFSKWGDTGVVDLGKSFGELIILTASRTLLGREVRENMFEEVAALYHDLDDGMRPISVFFPYLPTAFHKRRDNAQKEMTRLFGKVIAARREQEKQGSGGDNNNKEEDMLQHLMDSTYKTVNGGRHLTDTEITGLLIALLFAGQHTSSVTSSWTGYQLISHPDLMAQAKEEQKKVMAEHGNDLSMDVLNSMDYLHRCIMEALRMNPPLVLVMRLAKESFAVTTSTGKKYTVPKGDIVMASPTYSHRLDHVFKHPDEYQPDRYTAPRSEQLQMPFSYIGFGGGRHGCMGEKFAYLQIKTIWSILLRNFDFEMVDAFPEADYESMVIGPKPCRVRYTRKKL
jgi:sterol 14alpha-demethylase